MYFDLLSHFATIKDFRSNKNKRYDLSADCLSWVMARLSPTASRTASWRNRSVAKRSAGEVVAIDGKTLRHSPDRRNGCRAIHMVSAWANANQLSLGQIVTAEKSNELTVIPKLLELLEIKECIVTLDAMGCQKAIAAQIVAKGADCVLAVKANQPRFYAGHRRLL